MSPLAAAGVISAILAGVAGLITAVRTWLDSRHRPDEAWVGLVEKASMMLEERVERVEHEADTCQENLARTQRNIATLRACLINNGIPVPILEVAPPPWRRPLQHPTDAS